jgi:hypothetical protein
VSDKVEGPKRAKRVAALIREMNPARFEELCDDLVFDPQVVQTKCLLQRDRKMDVAEENHSMSRAKEIDNRTVYKDLIKFERAMLSNWDRLDMGAISLQDFARPGTPIFPSNTGYDGRRDLMEALESYATFMRVFKGEAFAGCMKMIRALFEMSGDPMGRYYTNYLQYELEDMIIRYSDDIRTRRRVSVRDPPVHSSMFPGQPMQSQQDCCALLALYVDAFVSRVQNNELEAAPHTLFNGPDHVFFSVLNKPLATAVPGSRVVSLHGPNPAGAANRRVHKRGLCVWHIANQLGLKSPTSNAIFQCRDTTFQHAVLKSITQKEAKALLNDANFVADCKSPSLKAEIMAAVDANPKRFK